MGALLWLVAAGGVWYLFSLVSVKGIVWAMAGAFAAILLGFLYLPGFHFASNLLTTIGYFKRHIFTKEQST
jgi:hypothetical protein